LTKKEKFPIICYIKNIRGLEMKRKDFIKEIVILTMFGMSVYLILLMIAG
jgi:hypothetical protein